MEKRKLIKVGKEWHAVPIIEENEVIETVEEHDIIVESEIVESDDIQRDSTETQKRKKRSSKNTE